MSIVITEEHLKIQQISIPLELNIFQKKLKSSWKQKYNDKIFIE